MIIGNLIKIYSDKLKEISDTPMLDVEMLLCKALGDVDRIYIHININKQVEESVVNDFIGMFEQRFAGRPIAYILNNREFMGLDFYVEEGVLIPRPDTEILVEEIIDVYNKKIKFNNSIESNQDYSILLPELDEGNKLKVVEIGTGSGAIAVSLAKYLDKSEVLTLDISDKALEIGKRNAESNQVGDRVELKKSNLFSAIEGFDKKFDIVVSNPPYIKREVIDTLHKQVKDFEPSLALDGGVDGLDFYKDISRESKKYLKIGGMIAYEVGHDQADEVKNILESEGFENIYVKKDLQSIDRVVIGFNL